MWPHVIVTLTGVWLTASPEVLGFGRPAAVSAWICGPLLATCATIAWWSATRAVRWWNLPVALWLAAAPMVLEHSGVAAANSVLCAAAAAGFSSLRGNVRHRFGGGWRALGPAAHSGSST